MLPTIWLSPTTMNMIDCPRCLFDKLVWKQKRPTGPFPSLPGGVDNAMKGYCDLYRGALPPLLKALVPQVPELEGFALHQDQRWLNTLRDWKGGIVYTHKIDGQVYKISGAIDDLLVRVEDGAFAILDYKSKAKVPEKGEGEKYYGRQMDAYELIFNKSGFPTTGKAFLWYVMPVGFGNGDLAVPSASMTFDNHVQVLDVSADRAIALIESIHKIIVAHPDRNAPPKSGDTCEYCNWRG